MAYGKYNNLNKRTQQDRVKTFKSASNPKYHGYQTGLSLIKNLAQVV